MAAPQGKDVLGVPATLDHRVDLGHRAVHLADPGPSQHLEARGRETPPQVAQRRQRQHEVADPVRGPDEDALGGGHGVSLRGGPCGRLGRPCASPVRRLPGGRVFQRRCSHSHCSGVSRTQPSMTDAMSCVTRGEVLGVPPRARPFQRGAVDHAVAPVAPQHAARGHDRAARLQRERCRHGRGGRQADRRSARRSRPSPGRSGRPRSPTTRPSRRFLSTSGSALCL